MKQIGLTYDLSDITAYQIRGFVASMSLPIIMAYVTQTDLLILFNP